MPDAGDIKHLALNGITQDTLSRVLACFAIFDSARRRFRTTPNSRSAIKVDHVKTQLGKHGGCFSRSRRRARFSSESLGAGREMAIQLIRKFATRML